MDGAIILSGDLKKILFANAQLIPSREIETRETGTRHRTAERTAKQTGELVISISQRRNIITIFKGNFRYILEDTNAVLNKANQGIQTLERYKKVFDSRLSILNEYEFNDIVTLKNVIDVIQRAEMVMRIADEIQRQIYELGNDGRLVKMQLDELIGGLEKEELLIIKDYMASAKKKKTPEKILEELSEISYEDVMRETTVSKLLGYETFDNYDEVGVYTRGYRILSKVPRMPANIVENLVLSFKSLQHILDADIESLDEVDGIGECRNNLCLNKIILKIGRKKENENSRKNNLGNSINCYSSFNRSSRLWLLSKSNIQNTKSISNNGSRKFWNNKNGIISRPSTRSSIKLYKIS